MDDSLWSVFFRTISRTAEIYAALCWYYAIYIIIVSICREVFTISCCSYISKKIAIVAITSDVFPVEVFFVVNGVIFQKQVDFFYGEVGVLNYIGSGLDIVFEFDHSRIDIEDYRQ